MRNARLPCSPRQLRIRGEGAGDPVESGGGDGKHEEAGAELAEDDLADPEERRVDGHDARDPVRPRQRPARDGLAAEAEPRPGFYARVIERIEAQGARSIWNLFFESAFGRRIAVAAMALALLLSVSLVTLERSVEPLVANQGSALLPGEDQPGLVLTEAGADKDAVLVNLVTYREQ